MSPTDHPKVLGPPPLIFGCFIAIGFAAQAIAPIGGPGFSYAGLLGIALVVWGFILSGGSVLVFLRHETHPDPYKPDTRLLTTGPYRYSRNPIYVAFLLMHIGIGLWVGDTWVLTTALPAFAVVHFQVVLPEERYLAERFGDNYDAYRRRVRRWL